MRAWYSAVNRRRTGRSKTSTFTGAGLLSGLGSTAPHPWPPAAAAGAPRASVPRRPLLLPSTVIKQEATVPTMLAQRGRDQIALVDTLGRLRLTSPSHQSLCRVTLTDSLGRPAPAGPCSATQVDPRLRFSPSLGFSGTAVLPRCYLQDRRHSDWGLVNFHHRWDRESAAGRPAAAVEKLLVCGLIGTRPGQRLPHSASPTQRGV